MKILRPGDATRVKLQPLKFACKICGCEFEADNTEYILADEYEQQHDAIKASCYCPCCEEKVFLYF